MQGNCTGWQCTLTAFIKSQFIVQRKKMKVNKPMPEGMGWRVAASILGFFGTIIGIIVWLFFYAGNYSVYQNIAVVAVILIAFVAVMGATWAAWGIRQAERLGQERELK